MTNFNDVSVVRLADKAKALSEILFPSESLQDRAGREEFIAKNSSAEACSLPPDATVPKLPKITGLIDNSARIEALRERHPAWWDQREKEAVDGVIYAIPEDVILLAKSLYEFSEADRRAEEEFARICTSMRAIGYCGQLFIDGITAPGDLSRTAEDFKSLERQIRNIRAFTLSEDEMRGLKRTLFGDWHDRQLGASGMLLCNGRFQKERLALRQQWLALPLNVRPLLPDFRLRPSMSWGDRKVEVFLGKVCEFKDRWHISSIATWDYVVARGPRMPDYRSEADVNYYPPRYHMRRDEVPSRKEFEASQRQAAADLVKERRRSYSYRRLFVTHFWNHVLEQRYRPISGKRPHGFIGGKLGLVASLIDDDASADRVEKDLKIIRRLQTGKQDGLGRS